jgi:hemerythrin-like domain-containing protein
MASQVGIWKQEHRNFAKLLDLLDAQVRVFHDGKTPDYQLMLDAIYYMVDYADRVHHPREDVVFERVAERVPESRSIIEGLKNEHGQLAATGQMLLGSLESVVNGLMLERGSVENEAQRYIAAFRRHMQAEEGDIITTAAATLTEQEWREIQRITAQQEDPLFGARLQARYEALKRHIEGSTA